MQDNEDPVEHERRRAEQFNLVPGHLTGYDCPICLNRGYIYSVNDAGQVKTTDCKCMVMRRNVRRIEKSGLKELLDKCTFRTWEVKEDWQREVAKKACDYIREKEGWMIAYGQSGSGKTHICTATCGELMKRGYSVRYMLWRDASTSAKAVVNDKDEYARLVEPLKRVGVLYIDDLFKTGKGQEPTTADVNLAFEILNARYIDRSKLTIISTELSLERILDIDEAVGSRIYERSRGYVLDFTEKKNWRLTT